MTVGIHDGVIRIEGGQGLAIFLGVSVVVRGADHLEMGSLVDKHSSHGSGAGFTEPPKATANVDFSEFLRI